MAEQEFSYMMNIQVKITGTESKKNGVRDGILAKLEEGVAAGKIDEATWSIPKTLIPEGGVIK